MTCLAIAFGDGGWARQKGGQQKKRPGRDAFREQRL